MQIIAISITTVIYSILMKYDFWHGGLSLYQKSIFALLISVGILLIFEFVIGYMILKKSTWPIQVITKKLSKKNILHDPKFEKTGLQSTLNFIDNLMTASPTIVKSSKNDLTQMIFNTLPVGVIALDHNCKIIAATKNAPISTTDKGQQIQLDFHVASESLQDWISHVTKSDIRAEKIWTRIQNKKPGAEDRRIFDVIAHYEKNSSTGIETMIITVDRTADYETGEEDIDFVSMAAHELRTPITVIRGYLEILEVQMAGKITHEERNSLERIVNASNNLSNYIANIMNVARHEHENLKSNIIETPVIAVINNIRDTAILNARVMRHNLTFEIPDNLPTVAADISLVSQVLNNLINNAIKYSPVNSNIIVRAKQANPQFIEFSVQDFGFGIAPSVAQDLFNKFHRSYKNKNFVRGVGFGLYLSRIIVKLHGGNIGFDSAEGKGSTFIFTLPIFAKYDSKKPLPDSNMTIKNHSRIMH